MFYYLACLGNLGVTDNGRHALNGNVIARKSVGSCGLSLSTPQ